MRIWEDTRDRTWQLEQDLGKMSDEANSKGLLCGACILASTVLHVLDFCGIMWKKNCRALIKDNLVCAIHKASWSGSSRMR